MTQLNRAERVRQQAADFRAGWLAFPGAHWMDSRRGTKGEPDHADCPFRRPDRVAAWEQGYSAAMDEVHAAF